MKYVMFKVPMGKDMHRLVPVLFDEFLVHKDVADWLSPKLGMPVSAGFVDIGMEVRVDPIRRSESLNMGPAILDDDVIMLHQYGVGIRENE